MLKSHTAILLLYSAYLNQIITILAFPFYLGKTEISIIGKLD